jgi:hypothetical protein
MPQISIPGEVWLRNHSSFVICPRKKFATILPPYLANFHLKELGQIFMGKSSKSFLGGKFGQLLFQNLTQISPKFYPNKQFGQLPASKKKKLIKFN